VSKLSRGRLDRDITRCDQAVCRNGPRNQDAPSAGDCPALESANTVTNMKVEPFDERSGSLGKVDREADRRPGHPPGRLPGAADCPKSTNHSPAVIGLIRRARRALPGDPDFGDRLSATGFGGPRTAARATYRLLGDSAAASREVGLATLQVWQALAERVTRQPANREITLVFTDLVGFSSWALVAGDDATLKLLRQVAQVVEPRLLAAGGQVVKRMGDGIMAVFPDAISAIRAVRTASSALKLVEVKGYTPAMRVGIHTGRPQRIGSDWLGVDVNVAARVMESAGKGGIHISGPTLEQISEDQLDALGVTVKRVRRPVFSHRPSGIPADISMYRLETRRQLPAAPVA
jgi:class 3 adenylate cyclase